MSKNTKKNTKELKRPQVEDLIENEGDNANREPDNPQDDSPPSVQDQISNIVLKLNEHGQALQALHNVPAILASLSQSLGLEDDNQSRIQDDSDTPYDDDLLANYMAEGAEEIESADKDADKDDSDLLEILNLSQPANEYGENLTEAVAKSFSSMVNNHPIKEKSERWKEIYKAPANCKELGVPRINPEIWPQLKNTSRHKDLSLQQHGSYISQASVAVSKIADLVFSNGKQVPKEFGQAVLKLATDAGSILGLASQELSAKRKAELRPNLNKEFVAICSNKTATTEYLFGDNVLEQLKASKSAANVMKPAFTQGFKNFRTHPYKPAQPSLNFKRPPFQPRGGSSFQRHQRPYPGKQFSQPPPQLHRRPN